MPWLVRIPGRAPHRHADPVVSLVDVAPTLLATVGVPIPQSMIGRDTFGSALRAERPVFSETEVRIGGTLDPDNLQQSVRRGSKKRVQRPTGTQCFDLESDPGERQPSCENVPWRDRTRLDLERWDRENEALAESLGAATEFKLDAKQREALRAIGYLE